MKSTNNLKKAIIIWDDNNLELYFFVKIIIKALLMGKRSTEASIYNLTEEDFDKLEYNVYVSYNGSFDLYYNGVGLLWANYCSRIKTRKLNSELQRAKEFDSYLAKVNNIELISYERLPHGDFVLSFLDCLADNRNGVELYRKLKIENINMSLIMLSKNISETNKSLQKTNSYYSYDDDKCFIIVKEKLFYALDKIKPHKNEDEALIYELTNSIKHAVDEAKNIQTCIKDIPAKSDLNNVLVLLSDAINKYNRWESDKDSNEISKKNVEVHENDLIKMIRQAITYSLKQEQSTENVNIEEIFPKSVSDKIKDAADNMKDIEMIELRNIMNNIYKYINADSSADSRAPQKIQTMYGAYDVVKGWIKEIGVVLNWWDGQSIAKKSSYLWDALTSSESDEAAIRRMLNYREHLFHSFNIFVLGLYIMVDLWNEDSYRNQLCQGASLTIKDIIRIWFLCSIYHDIGMSAEKMEKWCGHLLTNLLYRDYAKKNNMAERNKIVESNPIKISYNPSHIMSIQNYYDHIKLLIDNYENVIKVGPYYDVRKYEIIKPLTHKADHGVFSSLIVLDSIKKDSVALNNICNIDKIVSMATLAIAFHNNVTLSENGSNKLDLKLKPVEFKKFPFAYVLAFLDSIQNWGRPEHKIPKPLLLTSSDIQLETFKIENIEGNKIIIIVLNYDCDNTTKHLTIKEWKNYVSKKNIVPYERAWAGEKEAPKFYCLYKKCCYLKRKKNIYFYHDDMWPNREKEIPKWVKKIRKEFTGEEIAGFLRIPETKKK